MSTDTTTPRGSAYGRLWARAPKESLYLLAAFPIALAGFVITLGLFFTGIGTIITFFIGVVLIIAALYVSRGFGYVELGLLRWTGMPAIENPEWQDARARTGFFGWLRAVLGNGHYWLYLLHVMVIDFILKTISWSLFVTWISVSLGGLSYWFWDAFIPQETNDFSLSDAVFGWFGAAPADPRLADGILYFVLGAVFTALLPFVTRALTGMHWLVARGLLGPWRSDALQREVMTLNESRGAAQAAEGHSLRRLERDIHDGPQQRLVRLQMDLAAADRQLDADPDKARELIAEAMQRSKDALEELRALSRGFAPPILLDRGLVAALESAAVRSAIPARVLSELPDGFVVPQEIERNAYFVASEALVNAAKHSGATDIQVLVSTHADDRSWLDVSVTDNGTGGAAALPGHGIAGLEERLRGLGGTLEVLSPDGGPTIVAAHLPIATAPGGSAGS